MQGTVIASVCMNRNDFLLVSVREWIKLGLPILIVDWSSAEPVRETLRDHLDHVTIVEVPGKENFHLAKSKNLSYRAVRALYPGMEYVLSFDCDVYPKDPGTFLAKYPPDPQVLYGGGVTGFSRRRASVAQLSGESPGSAWSADDEKRNGWATYGTFLCSLSLLESVNMNDERMEGYGAFDVDLYNRIESTGAKKKTLAAKDLVHQPHGRRTENYAEKDLDRCLQGNGAIMKSKPPWGLWCDPERQLCSVGGMEVVL